MSLTSALTTALGQMLAPLSLTSVDHDELAGLLADLGIDVALDPDDILLISSAMALSESVDELLDLAGRPGGLNTADLVEQGLSLAARVFDLVAGFSDTSAADLAALPAPLDQPDTWVAIGQDLPDYLFTRWLRGHHPVVFAILRLGGVVHTEQRLIPLSSKDTVNWPALGELLTDPPGRLAAEYGWGGAFDHARLIEAIEALALALGLSARLSAAQLSIPMRTEGLGFLLGLRVVAAPAIAGGVPDGLLVSHQLTGDAGAEADLGDGWRLVASGPLDTGGKLGVRLSPDGLEPAVDGAPAGVLVRLTGAPPVPWTLLGDADGTSLRVERVAIGLAVEGTAEEPDLVVDIDAADALALVIAVSDGDTFLASVLGGASLTIRGGVGLRWSARQGFTLGGQLGLDVTVAVEKAVGPIYVDTFRVGVIAGNDGGSLEITATGSLTLGPITVVVQDLGIRAELLVTGSGRGRFGPTDVVIGLRMPTGLGIAVDAGGVVTGGGFLSLDREAGRYAGVAQLSMLGFGLTVIGIVETRLPDDPDGWSLFLSVIADFTPIQLGFGFTLNGVGGFMGLHRTMDADALGTGVREGRIDSVLFPRDPIASAPRILADIQEFFPTKTDSHSFGAMVKIGWGTPTLITAEVGLVVSLPELQIALLGELALVLPTVDAPILELHMGVLGVVDIAQGTLSITASIYDSQIVGIALSGDMAMYVSLGSSPYFLLSVGGYNPGWKPPSCVPSSMRDLSRMAMSVDLSPGLEIGLESYLALTPNTLQFGATVWAVARVHTLGIDFTAEGSFGFDVQFTFSPFELVAGMHAGVSIKAEGRTLIGVQLRLHLEGPEPWYATGHADFRFLAVDVRFQVEVGHAPGDENADTVDLWREVEPRLRDPGAWQATRSTGLLPEVGLRALDPSTEPGLWLRPDDLIEVRQQLLPLNRDITAYGARMPAGPTRFDIEAAGLAAGIESAWQPTREWFAPAQFTTMDPVERMSAPSFELMDAGISLGATGVLVPDDIASVVLGHEEKVIDGSTGWTVKPMSVQRLAVQRLTTPLASWPRAAHGPAGRYVAMVGGGPITVATTRYTLVDALDAVVVRDVDDAGPATIHDGGFTFADALAGRRAGATAGQPRPRIVPVSTARVRIILPGPDLDPGWPGGGPTPTHGSGGS